MNQYWLGDLGLGNEQAYDGGNNPIVVLTYKPDAPNDCWVSYFERAVAE